MNAMVNDFTRAAVGRDVSETFWRNVYKSNSVLSEFSPSRVRIVEAKISLPVAIEDIGESSAQDTGITPEQIASVLSPRLARQERSAIATEIHARLARSNKHLYLNKGLVKDTVRVASQVHPDLDTSTDIDTKKLASIQKDFASRPHKEQETRFLYKVADLEKVNPEHIVRLEFTLGID